MSMMRITLIAILFFNISVAQAYFVPSTGSYPLDQAIRAAYIQTGLDGKETMVTRYAEQRATHYVNKLGITTYVGNALLVARVVRERRLTIPLKAGRYLTLEPDRCTISLPWNWR